ncbi:TonB-dependent receptor [Stenotrophomonas maltophilia]|uniref:TonB-dependent receptor plug domain-containing protein n=1 Tax=Stenotrophomonas maltophilia TaxID=40324 RepID=UPI0015DD6883|nr:TonB-dependent receptor [Stenotrophomonas maltophilia]MBA0348497.1 TonB-dependent receptor [Stenotrophomonas maltophilia]
MNVRTPAVRLGLLPAGIALALAPAFASAQEASAPTTLDRLEVTGSRIRSVDVETSQPVLTVSHEDIQRSGLVSVGDLLQNLSVAGTQTFSKAAVLASNPEQGGQYVSLYNLGEQRTLVLVNGKRWSTSLAGFTDMSTIPTSLIERIEVLKDGASAIYGSDAISGVVNIILRKNFDGAEASAYYGQNSHGDGSKTQYSLTLGASGERSSIVFGANYIKEDPVWAKDRGLTKYSYGQGHKEDGLSPAGPWGRFTDPRAEGTAGAGEYNKAGKWVPNTWVVNHTGSWDTPVGVGQPSNNFNNYHLIGLDDYYNASQQMMLNQGAESKTMFTSASYDINDNLRLKSTAMYSERDSKRQIAGYPLTGTSQPQFPVAISKDSIYNPLGNWANPGAGVDIGGWGRRIFELPRITQNNVKSLHFDAALEGNFDFNNRPFDWDVGINYNQFDVTQTSSGNINLLALKNALGPSFINANGVAQCGTAANPIALGTSPGSCVPFDLLGGASAATPDALKYINTLLNSTGQSKSKQYFANITGSLFDMPGDAGEFAFAAGYEHREVSGYDHPDALSSSGYTTELAAQPTEGKYKTNEFYLELMVPLLRDLPGAKELSLDIASRYSDYDKFGNTVNSKFSVTWKPIDDLLVRATYGEGFRAPTLDDTFGGGSQTFDKFTDPCDAVFGQRSNPAVAARCGAEGLASDFRQTDAAGRPISARDTQGNNPFNSGVGNDKLQPETSKTRTTGLVWSPSFVSGLNVSLDWYKITVDNVITALSANYVLNQCYQNGVQAFCDQYSRGDVANGQQVTGLSRGNANLGSLETEGYNFGVRYRMPEYSFGTLSFNLDTNYLTSFRQQATKGAAWDDYAGYWNYPRVRGTLASTWTKGDLSATWTMRYYGGFRDFCYDQENGLECNQPDYYTENGGWSGGLGANKKGAIVYHDISATWQAPWNGSVTVGARNVFGKTPPITYAVTNASAVQLDPMLDYDRFLFIQYNQRF